MSNETAPLEESSMATTEATFADLGIKAEVLHALTDLGYTEPSPIQAQTIPHLLNGEDVVGLAQTGTGKTAAFAIPILSQIDPALRKPQALVLAPTRELALQVADAFSTYAKHLPKVTVLPIYGGQNYSVQLSGLRKGANVVVGTPGRVIDHLDRGTLDLTELDFLVLDEADEMLTMGFHEDVERILRDTPEYKQVALFSATMPQAISRLSKKYLSDPVEIRVESKTTTSATINQKFIVVTQSQKFDALTRYLEVEQADGVIVFVRTKQSTEELALQLRHRGFRAAAINGDIVQAQRERTITQLKEGAIDILIATDVAARGLDVERISLVVNYDIPRDTESYVHRIGRTGRAGRQGDAVLFITPKERSMLKALERAIRQPLREIPLPSVDQVNERRIAKFSELITKNLTSDHRILFKDLIEKYAEENSIDLVDIAAALAVEITDAGNFLLPPDPVKSTRGSDAWDDRNSHSGKSDNRGKGSRSTQLYRIEVGSKNKVSPRNIVGAIASEGGLRRSDFGQISIRSEFSLIELPADLDKGVLTALRNTRIVGKPINIKIDTGKAPRQRQSGPSSRSGSGGYAGAKRPRRGGGDRQTWGKK